jgi:hypothetical protein
MIRRSVLPTLALAIVVTITTLSAHQVRSVSSSPVKAFVSSPTPANDAPIAIQWVNTQAVPPTVHDTGLRVACFFVANPSAANPARPEWPRITSVGFELPGTPSGFALMEPLDSGWELSQNVAATLAGKDITLAFMMSVGVHPTGRTPGQPEDPLGVPPGQPDATRGVGTRFCVSGPFPAQLTRIEDILNGVVVGFHGVEGHHQGVDAGVWFTHGGLRPIPLY